MEKKRYVAPLVREVTTSDLECQILGTSLDQKNIILVDPLDEKNHYYDGTESSSDYLIKF